MSRSIACCTYCERASTSARSREVARYAFTIAVPSPWFGMNYTRSMHADIGQEHKRMPEEPQQMDTEFSASDWQIQRDPRRGTATRVEYCAGL